ncbi:hypothetical protein Tco_0740468 [Tanacetum coccineum]
MDSMIPNRQRNTLAEYMILSGADNRPPMLDKDLYDSWKNRMELYMQNREHGRMILESVEHGPLIWHAIEENGVIRTKKYAELSATEKIQANCDMKATNIILQGLPTELYSLLINDMNIYNMKLEQFQVHTKFLNSLPSEWSKFVTDVKLVKDLHTTNFDQLHAYLQQYELHANEVQTKPLFKTAGSQCNKFREDKGKVILVLVIRVMLLVLEEIMQVDRQGLLNATTVKVKDIWLGNVLSLRPKNAAWFKDEAMLVEAQEAGHILDEEQLAFLADPEVPHSETYLNNDMENQSVHAMQDFEQLFKILICRTTRFNDFISLKSSEYHCQSEVPKELPKVFGEMQAFQNLNSNLAQFDICVKERITHNARTEDILNEITEVQTIFDQMEAAVQQSSVDKQCLEIAKKELLLENDRLLQQIMSQEVLLTVMNSMFLNGESVNVGMQRSESYKSCDNQDALEILEYFEINDLKAQLQDKDTTISKVVPPKKTTSHSVETQNPELKVYSRRPKQIKNVGSSKNAKIVESMNANNLEPNHNWGSNATDIPSSSSFVNDRLSRSSSGIWTPVV